jgi:hypothetical protein
MQIRDLNPEPEFKPIELAITIESKRELELLWCMFNASPASTANFLNDANRSMHKISDFTSTEICQGQNRSQIWSFFEEKMKRL